MTSVTSLLQRACDCVLKVFLPRASAAAADCWSESYCDKDAWGSVWYKRTCCYYANLGKVCGPRQPICVNCC